MDGLLRFASWLGTGFLCGMMCLCGSLTAIADNAQVIYPGEDNEQVEDEIIPVEIRFYDGDGEIEAGDGSRPRFGRRLPSSVKGGTCGQGNDCGLLATEDVVLALDIPTSGNWSFSLCGSSFDTYIFVGYSPCGSEIGSNDDFCGTNSLAGCLWVQAGPVYVTIEGGANTCGKFLFTVRPCVPGRCCYMQGDSAACENTTLDDCAAIGGFWDAEATCEANPCPTGRCCYRIGNISECTENMLQKPCLFTLEGEWTENGSCSEPCIFENDTSGCGPMDLVLAIDVTGSMSYEIDAVREESHQILATAAEAANQDLRVALVVFRDVVTVIHPLTDNLEAVDAAIGTLDAGGGDGSPEASDIALEEIISGNGTCVSGAGFSVPFRPSASKVVVLITDAPNGGCDDAHQAADSAFAHEVALEALSAEVYISPVYVYSSAINPVTNAVMRDYAETTGGLYVLSHNGAGIAESIGDIIQQCGRMRLAMVDDSLPDITCFNDEITPSTFDIMVSVVNRSEVAVADGGLALSEGSGPGGTGTVNSVNPFSLGVVQPGDTVDASFTVTITPAEAGGCINFTAYLLNGADTVGTRTVCVNIPVTSLVFGQAHVPILECDGDGVTPTTFEIGVTVRNDSECATSLGSVVMASGFGPGGTGTVESAAQVSTGMLEPGDSTMVYFTVDISPTRVGGCINFRAFLLLDGDTLLSRNLCVNVPQFSVVMTSHSTPQLSCVNDEIVPTTFDIMVVAFNNSACDVTGARMLLGGGSGAGGSGFVVGSQSVDLGSLSQGEQRTVTFTVTIDPNTLGGLIRFTAFIAADSDTASSRNIDISVPACGCESSDGIFREISGYYYWECICVQLCDTVPVPVSICRPSGAFSTPPAAGIYGQCQGGCAPGQGVLNPNGWVRNGECWENEIYMTLPGCVRLCMDYVFPVELASFDAIPEYEQVRVVWSTASESQLERFEILRDGALMSVIPATNAPTGSSYEWLDTYVEQGRVYRYSLVVTDMSGSREELASATAMPLAQPEVSSGYALLPNYPNPFNGTTTIGFDLPEATDVVLTVYDVSGRRVAELVNGRFDAGRHEVSFGGEGLASGVYFCHMVAGVYATRQKMLLLK